MSASLRRFTLAVAAATLLGTAPAAALSVEKVRNAIDSWLASATVGSDGEFDTKGALTVRESGDEIIARLPTLVLNGHKAAIEVPDVVLHLQSTGKDRIAFTADLPDRLPISGLDTNKSPATLTIGSHRVSGVYRPSILYVQQLDAALGDVLISSDLPLFRIGSLALDYDSTEVAPDDWTIDGQFVMSDVELVSASGPPILSLARLTQRMHAENVEQKRYADEIKRIFGEDGASDTGLVTPEQLRRRNSLLLAVPDFFGAFGTKMMLEDLVVSWPDTAPMRIGQLTLSGGMEPSDADLSRLTFTAALSDVHLPPNGPAQLPAALMPSLLDVEVHVDRFPGSVIWHDFMTSALAFEAATADDGDAETGSALRQHLGTLGPQVLAAMAKAGTVLNLPKLELKAGPASLTGNAKIGLPPGAAPDRPLAADVVIAGLDELTQQLTDGPEPADQDILGGLMLLRGLGQPKEAPDGEREYHYKLSRSQDGAVLLNGLALEQLQQQ